MREGDFVPTYQRYALTASLKLDYALEEPSEGVVFRIPFKEISIGISSLIIISQTDMETFMVRVFRSPIFSRYLFLDL